MEKKICSSLFEGLGVDRVELQRRNQNNTRAPSMNFNGDASFGEAPHPLPTSFSFVSILGGPGGMGKVLPPVSQMIYSGDKETRIDALKHPDLTHDDLYILGGDLDPHVRKAAMSQRGMPLSILRRGLYDTGNNAIPPNEIPFSVLKNPALPIEILKEAMLHPDPSIRSRSRDVFEELQRTYETSLWKDLNGHDTEL